MAEPIKIDLRDLTPEKLAECKPHLGEKRYDAPCVIGALMPPSIRAAVNHSLRPGLLKGVVVASGQDFDVRAIQCAFDAGRWERVLEIASKYTNTDSGAAHG